MEGQFCKVDNRGLFKLRRLLRVIFVKTLIDDIYDFLVGMLKEDYLSKDAQSRLF